MAERVINCPACGSQIKIDTQRKFTFCGRCGAKAVCTAWTDQQATEYKGGDAAINPGDVIRFGMYKQDNDTSGFQKEIEWKEIEWIVLEKKDGKALMISKYALDCQKYNTDYKSATKYARDFQKYNARSVTWEICTLRAWLNGTFLNRAFSASEQSRIQTTKLTAHKSKYDTPPGNDTMDKIFLLSIPEVKKYFSTDTARRCAPTAYARAHGAHTFEWKQGTHPLKSNKTEDGEAACSWWLRSPGCRSDRAGIVNDEGSVFEPGAFFVCDKAVRPALWINL